MAIAAILRRDHHWSGNFLEDGGEEIYRNGTEGSNPACSRGESDEIASPPIFMTPAPVTPAPPSHPLM
jgi:hypothetical protein